MQCHVVVRDDDDDDAIVAAVVADVPSKDSVACSESTDCRDGYISVTESSPSIVKFSMSTKFSSLR